MKILVIRFSSLGDLVTLEPVFRSLRHFFVDAQIDFLTTSTGQQLYGDSGYFDRCVLQKGVLGSVRELGSGYDIVLNLQCNKPSHFIVLLLKKKLVVNKSYNLWQKIFGVRVHSKDNRELLDAMRVPSVSLDGYFSDEQNNIIHLPAPEPSLPAAWQDKPTVMISTGSSARWPSKQWGVQRYSQLIGRLLQHNLQVVLLGSDLEAADAATIAQQNPGVINLVDQAGLAQLKALLSRASLYIGNDSGPAHIAAAVGANTITIFGSTDERHCVKNMAYAGEHRCLKPDASITCHPCYLTQCPTQHECMQSITVDRVYTTAMQMLGKQHAAA
ncbi:MAG: glycosyltransferase family 9 protein [Chromatiales bacterium]|jgi:ADP-heptose:LPS heptosyltransferase